MKIVNFTKMIVHGGAHVHRDDFLCMAIAWAAYETIEVIKRRDPNPYELADPKCLVCDVGGVYDPKLHNYDHHQFDPATDTRCAFDLFVSAEGLDFNGFRPDLMPWLTATSMMDTQGPYKTAQHYNMAPDALMAVLSPVESVILDWIGRAEVIERGSHVSRLLHRVGHELAMQAADMSVKYKETARGGLAVNIIEC